MNFKAGGGDIGRQYSMWRFWSKLLFLQVTPPDLTYKKGLRLWKDVAEYSREPNWSFGRRRRLSVGQHGRARRYAP